MREEYSVCSMRQIFYSGSCEFVIILQNNGKMKVLQSENQVLICIKEIHPYSVRQIFSCGNLSFIVN